MKTLILGRHAKSDWPAGVSDLHRPLKQRGFDDAQWLAELLQSQGVKPDQVITSPAKRAMTTADIFRKTLLPEQEMHVEPLIYYDGVAALIQMIQHLDRSLDTVMVFGHNPTIEHALTYLLGAKAAFEVPTCGLASLELRSDSWRHFETQNLHLRWFLIPRLQRQS